MPRLTKRRDATRCNKCGKPMRVGICCTGRIPLPAANSIAPHDDLPRPRTHAQRLASPIYRNVDTYGWHE